MAERKKRINKVVARNSPRKTPTFEIFKDDDGYYSLNGFDKLPDEQRRVSLTPSEINSYFENGNIKNPDIFKGDPLFTNIWDNKIDGAADDIHEDTPIEESVGESFDEVEVEATPATPATPAAPEKSAGEAQTEGRLGGTPAVGRSVTIDKPTRADRIQQIGGALDRRNPHKPRMGNPGSSMPDMAGARDRALIEDWRGKNLKEMIEADNQMRRKDGIVAHHYDRVHGYGAFDALEDKSEARKVYTQGGQASEAKENARRQKNLIDLGLLEDTPEARRIEAAPRAPADLQREADRINGGPSQRADDQVTAELERRANAGKDVVQTFDEKKPEKGGYKPPATYQRPGSSEVASLDNLDGETVQEGTMGPYADFNSPNRRRVREEKVGPFPVEDRSNRKPEEMRPWLQNLINPPAPETPSGPYIGAENTPKGQPLDGETDYADSIEQSPPRIQELPPQDPFQTLDTVDQPPSITDRYTSNDPNAFSVEESRGPGSVEPADQASSEEITPWMPPQDSSSTEQLTPFITQPTTAPADKGFLPPQLQPNYQPDLSKPPTLEPTAMPDGTIKYQQPDQETYLAPDNQIPDNSHGLRDAPLPPLKPEDGQIPTLTDDGQMVDHSRPAQSLETLAPAPAPTPAPTPDPDPDPDPAPAPSMATPAPARAPFQPKPMERNSSSADSNARPISQAEMFYNSLKKQMLAGGRNEEDVRRDFQLKWGQISKMHPAERDNYVNRYVLKAETATDINPLSGKQSDIDAYRQQQELESKGWKGRMQTPHDQALRGVNNSIMEKTENRGPRFHTNPKYGNVGNADREYKNWKGTLNEGQLGDHRQAIGMPRGTPNYAEVKRQEILGADMSNPTPRYPDPQMGPGGSHTDVALSQLNNLSKKEQAKRLGANHLVNPF